MIIDETGTAIDERTGLGARQWEDSTHPENGLLLSRTQEGYYCGSVREPNCVVVFISRTDPDPRTAVVCEALERLWDALAE
jgi:hypothetical protein